jgi:hypothetical protein
MSSYIRPKVPMAQQQAQQRDDGQHGQKTYINSHGPINSAALVRQPTLAEIMKALDTLNKDIKTLSVRINNLEQSLFAKITQYFDECVKVLEYEVRIGFLEMDYDRIWMHMSLASLQGVSGPIWFGPPLNRIIDVSQNDVFSFIPDEGGAKERAVPWEDINGVQQAILWGRIGNLQETGSFKNVLGGGPVDMNAKG